MPSTNRGVFNGVFQGVAVLEDFADRLSHVWTVGLLLIVASIVSWKQEFQQPIHCFTPEQFTSAMVDHAHATCWASQNYFVPFLEKIPLDVDLPHFNIINYKWLPVILVIQALLFKVPNIFMHVLHGFTGISFEKIAGFTQGFANLNLAERSQLGQQIGHYLYFWCLQFGGCLPWRGLTMVWLLVKTLFCINATVQFSLVEKFLSTRNPPFDMSTSYGDVIYNNLLNKNVTEWTQSPAFPRVVLCDYQVRMLTNVQRFTTQCTLSTSEFNEYVYMLIWIWLLVVCVVSWLSLAVWLVLTLLPFMRQRYISKMLNLTGEQSAAMQTNADKLSSLVGEDGVTVLKLLSSNSCEMMVRDAVWSMSLMSQKTPQTQPMQHVSHGPYVYARVASQPPIAPNDAAVSQPDMTTVAHDQGKLLHVQ